MQYYAIHVCDINLCFMHTIQGEIQILYRIEVQTLLIDCYRYDFVTEIADRESGQFVATGTLGKNNIASLALRTRVVCKQNYNGFDCGNMICEPQGDSSGHFTCDINGNKVCLPGYQNPGTNCVEAVTTMIPITDTTISIIQATSVQTTIIQTASVISTTAVTSNNGIPSITMISCMPSQTTRAPALVGMDIVPIAAGAATACLLILLLILIVNIVAVVLILKSRNRRQAVIVEGAYTVLLRY